MSSLTSILCLDNRTTRSETSTKTQCAYFCEIKKLYFASAYFPECHVFENFASTCFCELQVFENFEFITFCPKQKRTRKRQLNQGTFG